MSLSPPPASPPRQRPLSRSRSRSPDHLSIFTPQKRSAPINQNPLFFSPAASTSYGSPPRASGSSRPPSKRPRLVSTTDTDHPSTRPPVQSTDDLLAIFDDDSDSGNEAVSRQRRSYQVAHAQTEPGLNGSAVDPYAMGNGGGALIGRDLGLGGAGAGSEGAGADRAEDEIGEDGKKKRKPMPKLDQERLIGSKGFPALITKTPLLLPQLSTTKGSEHANLNHLLEMYKLWAHGLYPKLTFGDVVGRVEGLCRGRLMTSTLNQYREQAKRAKEAQDRPFGSLGHDDQVPGEAGPHELTSTRNSGNEDDDDMGQEDRRTVPSEMEDNPFLSPRSRARLALDRARYLGANVGGTSEQDAASGSRGRVGGEQEVDQEEEDLDLDAMIAAAEAEANELVRDADEDQAMVRDASESGAGSAAGGKGKEREVAGGGFGDYGGEDEDEDAWAAMDGM